MKPYKLLVEDRRRLMAKIENAQMASQLKAEISTNKFALVPFLDSEIEKVREELCSLDTNLVDNYLAKKYAEINGVLRYLKALRESLRDPDTRLKELTADIKKLDRDIQLIENRAEKEIEKY